MFGITNHETNTYFNADAWGDEMEAIYKNLTEPCFFAQEKDGGKIKQLFTITHRLLNGPDIRIHESGEANHYTILKGDNSWVC